MKTPHGINVLLTENQWSVDQVQIMIIKKSYKKKKLLKSTFIIINYDLDKKPCYSFEKKNYPK